MPATRKQRLQEVLREELSDVIRREMRDPRFTEGLLSITDVDVTADYKHATIYISVFGNQDAKNHVLAALRGAGGMLRGELGRRKAFKTVPALSFEYDDAMERGMRIFDALERIKQEDALRPQHTEAESGEAAL